MTSARFQIRQYRDSDLPTVLEITVEAFGEASIERRVDSTFPDVSAPVNWAAKKSGDVAAELSVHPDGCYVAETGGRVVGYITTAVIDAREQGRVANLAVDHRYRSLGIGRALLERALEDFRARGLRIARIETLADNPVGCHLYPSLGFVEIARQIHFALRLD